MIDIKILILLVVFLTAILLHFIMRKQEGFQTRTPLTKENVQALLDSAVQDIVSNYQKLKTDSENVNDKRIKYRLVDIGNLINLVNLQYPEIQYKIETYNYSSVQMISLEDLKLIKDFLLAPIGIQTPKMITDSIDISDLDIFTRRFQSLVGILQQKLAFVQGSSSLVNQMNQFAQSILTNMRKLKLDLPTLKPQDIPVLKIDLFYYVLSFAASNFIYSEETMNSSIPVLQLGNLPAGKSITSKIINAVTPTAPTAPTAPTTPTAPTAPTAPTTPTAPIPSTPTGMKFSELVKTLMTYGPITEATPETEDIEEIVSKEVESQLQKVKLGPKDQVNGKLSERTTEPVKPETPIAPKTNGLVQGSWFRSAAQEGCPYAQGQQVDPSLPPQPFPIDMNDYIRKDSIPCWACTLK
jgi:hypothetical protein